MEHAPSTVLLRLPVATAKQLGLVPTAWDSLSALKGVVRHEGEAASIEAMHAAIAAGAVDSGVSEPSPYTEQPAPESHWNYRIMEFHEGGETWREFREVHYRHRRPEGYSAASASPFWYVDEGDEAATFTLDRMREALTKPILRPGDFRGSETDRRPDAAQRLANLGGSQPGMKDVPRRRQDPEDTSIR